MKKLFVIIILLISSCTLTGEKHRIHKKLSNGDDGNEVECKPQREILVNGKCIKRRGFM